MRKVVTDISANQTTAMVDGYSKDPILMQAVVSGGTLTAGTLKAQVSLDGVNFDATTYPYSFTYQNIASGLIQQVDYGFPFAKFTLASLAFNYGKTQTGSGLSDLTIAGTYTPLTAHTYIIKIHDEDVDLTAASTTLTTTSTKPVDGAVVVLGGATYRFVDALEYAAVKSQALLTSTGVTPSDGDAVKIGSVTYTFKTTLTTDPDPVPNEVLIGASAAEALDNLKAAVNASGVEGTNYGTGTTSNPDAEATTNTDTTQLFVALLAGAAGNSIDSMVLITEELTFPAAQFTLGADAIAQSPFDVLIGASAAVALDNLKAAVNGDAGESTTFGTGTTANADISATTNTDTTQLFVAQVAGITGNVLASTTTGAHLSFPALHLTGGLDALGDKFVWNKDGGAWSSPITVDTTAQTVVDGITAQFAAADEHTPGDYWTVTPAAITVFMSK